MTPTSLTFSITSPQIHIWLVGVSFVLFQFFLQLSSGVVIGSIMDEMQLSALATGILSSAFYYVYTSLQIPVGLLFDIKSTRFLLTGAALICSVGCIFFAQSHSLFLLILSRLLIGGGAAFAFIGLSHLLRQHFPLTQFAFMIGLSETLGFLVTMLGMISLGLLINHWGWRAFINSSALAGLIIAALSWKFIPPNVVPVSDISRRKQLLIILTSGKLWVNGVFVGLSFTVITVFGAMWAIPFIQVKLGCSLKDASIIDSLLFCGAALSCPLFGYLAGRLSHRRFLMLFSCLTTALLIMVALFLPIQSAITMAVLMFFIGLCCGAYMLAYSISNELAPKNALSTCTGFINTLAMLSAPLMQPLVGYLLDLSASQPNHVYQIGDYQLALVIIPAGLVIASGLVFLLPEKNQSLQEIT
ncbi:MAG: MFS transporter [Legionella sp.]|nr:MFS transporter [Legionella sp.]